MGYTAQLFSFACLIIFRHIAQKLLERIIRSAENATYSITASFLNNLTKNPQGKLVCSRNIKRK